MADLANFNCFFLNFNWLNFNKSESVSLPKAVSKRLWFDLASLDNPERWIYYNKVVIYPVRDVFNEHPKRRGVNSLCVLCLFTDYSQRKYPIMIDSSMFEFMDRFISKFVFGGYKNRLWTCNYFRKFNIGNKIIYFT